MRLKTTFPGTFVMRRRKRSLSRGTANLPGCLSGSPPRKIGLSIALSMIRDFFAGSPKHVAVSLLERASSSERLTLAIGLSDPNPSLECAGRRILGLRRIQTTFYVGRGIDPLASQAEGRGSSPLSRSNRVSHSFSSSLLRPSLHMEDADPRTLRVPGYRGLDTN